MQNLTDVEIKELWLKHLELMFPRFERHWIRYYIVQRARYVEPLHPLNGYLFLPPIHAPIENLYLVSNAQIYPTLTNGESISRKAREIARLIMAEPK
jgi:hypothetical protein